MSAEDQVPVEKPETEGGTEGKGETDTVEPGEADSTESTDTNEDGVTEA